jgi:hypothetical protein
MPIVNIPDKVCPHCDGTRWLVRKNTSSKTDRYTCALKNLERVTAWKERNPEKYKKAREKVHLRAKLYRQEHKLPRKRKTFKNHLSEEQLKDVLLKAKSDNISTKTCKTCNKEKKLSSFKLTVRKTGKVYTKPSCENCYHKRHMDENRERRNELAKISYKNRTEEQRKKHNLWAAEWRNKNPNKMKIKSTRLWQSVKTDPIKKEKKNKLNCDYLKKCRETLSDGYVISRIIGKEGVGILYRKDIPQDLIDMKRTQLLLKRQIA